MAGAPGFEPGDGGIKIQLFPTIINGHSENRENSTLIHSMDCPIFRNGGTRIESLQPSLPQPRLCKFEGAMADRPAARRLAGSLGDDLARLANIGALVLHLLHVALSE